MIVIRGRSNKRVRYRPVVAGNPDPDLSPPRGRSLAVRLSSNRDNEMFYDHVSREGRPIRPRFLTSSGIVIGPRKIEVCREIVGEREEDVG